MTRPKMTPLRASAKGEDCTLNVAGVCNYDTTTTVLCHMPIVGEAGGGQKCEDYCSAYGCNCCHDWIDNRNGVHPYEERLFYAMRGIVRTWRRMIQKGLIQVKGIAA